MLTGAAIVLATGLSTFVGCGDSGGTTDGDGENPELADVVYETGATDEALEALLAATPETDAAHAATFTWPSDGDIVTADSVPTFCWQAGPTARLDVRTPRVGVLTPAPRAHHEASTFDVAARAVLGPLLAHVQPAYAHGDPVNGPGYFLVFSTASNDKLVRVFTTGLDYTPDADHWDTLKGAGAEITATVTSATFDSNRIADGGGPWNGTPIKFTIH